MPNLPSTSTINAVLETAREPNSAMIIQFSNSGASFFAGKGLGNQDQAASIAGDIAGAHYVHQLTEIYDLPIPASIAHAYTPDLMTLSKHISSSKLPSLAPGKDTS